MSDEATPHSAPRARPVADLPIPELARRCDELARAWAVALILSRPPSEIAAIPLEDLARDAPRLCEQILRALSSDAELARLTATDSQAGREDLAAGPTLGSLAAARDVPSLVAAVEALRGVLWEALLDALHRPVFDRSDAHLLADLADRLAYVCVMTLAAALPAVLGRVVGDRGEVIVAGAEGVPARPYSPSPAPGDPPRIARPRELGASRRRPSAGTQGPTASPPRWTARIRTSMASRRGRSARTTATRW